MKKIGLILAYNSNYGAMLQAYALQNKIRELGCHTEIISFRQSGFKRHVRMEAGLIPIYWNKIVCSLFKNYNASQWDDVHKENLLLREKETNIFIKENLFDIKVYGDYKSLKEGAKAYDAIVVGSDQMWLPESMLGFFNSMYFVPNYVRKISYATSLGVSHYPWYAHHGARKAWNRMDFISVREEQGRNIISKICKNLHVEIVCDPTYLYDKDSWLKFIPYKQLSSDRYVLCYFLGNNPDLFIIAKEFARIKGLKVVSILSVEYSVNGDLSFADITVKGASPQDFINWIRGAEYVLTDSFHGIAFSVINEKQFYVFYPKRDNIKQSRNSRIDNILNMWDCKDRLVFNLKDLELVEIPIDYNFLSPKVCDMRHSSISFLKEALSFND